MKITIITSPFSSIPPNTIGAVERLWYNMAKVFINKEHEVAFVAKRFDGNDKNGINKDKIYIDYIKGFSAKKHIFQTLFYDFFYSVRALFKIKKCDILILNTFWSPVLCIFFKKKFNISIYNVARFPKKQFFLYRFVDRLSCVSIAVMNALEKQTPSAKKQLKVINNPINTAVFYPVYKERNDNCIKLVYTGRVHQEKGLDILVKSFSILKKEYPNLQLSIIGARDIARGGGGIDYENHLKSLTGKYEVNFIAPIYDQCELRDEMANNDIFCYPSVAEKGETFGVAPLEAMATGIPTIVSKLECFQDFVKNGENALVFNHRIKNPEQELCKTIKILIKDKYLREKIAKNGAIIAKGNFNTEKIADEYLEDFQQLLNKKGEKNNS
jgi:glycosyltransferase involved in cell wall biosynthesis